MEDKKTEIPVLSKELVYMSDISKSLPKLDHHTPYKYILVVYRLYIVVGYI